MRNNINKSDIEKPFINSEFIFIENIIIVLFLSPFIFGMYDNSFLSVLYIFITIYTTTTLLFRKIYFYSDYLIILYPTRLFFKKRKIEYKNIKKIKYVYGKSGYAVPEIQIRLKNTVFFHFYASFSEKKRKEILQYLYKIGLNVEIKSKDWEDNRILKNVEKNKEI